MRVLFLTHPEANYGAHYFYNGLCRVLGHENVYDYPNDPTFHGNNNNGYIRPWHHNEPGNTDRLKWFDEGYPEKPLDVEAVSGLLRDGFVDLVVLESWRWTVQQSWRELEADIRASGAKVILHDGEDFSFFHTEALDAVNPHYYLKRELLKGTNIAGMPFTVLPFPFSAPDQIVEWADAQPPAVIERDIACLLGLSWQPRQQLAEELRRGMDAGEYTGYVATNADSDRNNPQHLLGFWHYLQLLRTSRFGVSMRGWGWDTCRMHEVSVLTGLLVDELDIRIPHPFTHGVNAYVYHSIPQARDLAQCAARNLSNWKEIREAGIAHARTHHTNSARVKWLLERVAD